MLFTKDHEWMTVADGVATVGISDYAQRQLGDVVFVELPDVGKKVAKGDEVAVVESVKAASEVYAPIDGEVVAVNDRLTDTPDLVNAAAESDGWFVRIKLADVAQTAALMDRAAYDDFVAGID